MIKYVERKSITIKESGRSTDFITPSFIMGCGYNCGYCYCKRHKTDGVDVAINVDAILAVIDHHTQSAKVKKPNQTHPELISYDFGCNSDMALHLKHYEWKKVFDFFKNHPRAMGSFATKYVNPKLLDYNPNKKIRIRFSLMPDKISRTVEPSTSSILDRINTINSFIEAGYDVHINFSPIIVYDGWLKDYEELFNQVNGIVKDQHKPTVLAECIFLTHNKHKHEYNLANGLAGEELLWAPHIQENKVSQYGGDNIRYQYQIKARFIREFTKLHDSIIKWNTIRYIF